MTKITHLLTLTALILSPTLVSANVSCDDLEAPITSVADFDGNGTVNGKDIAILTKMIHKKNTSYGALYDRNEDGELDNIDLFLATRDMSKSSTADDQELVAAYNGVLQGTYTCSSTVTSDVQWSSAYEPEDLNPPSAE